MTTLASPESNPLSSASEARFAVLLFTDIVGSTDLKARHGVPAYSAALRVHNDHFERIARECRGIRILQNMGDGYFAEAGGVSEAVRFALLFQEAMRAGPWAKIQLTTRVGIHAGEVTALVAEGGSGIVAPAADLAARVMSLAVGGQILLTRFPFDETRHFVREHPAATGKDPPPLCWLAHGPYLLKGRDEPMEIFEVGAEGLAPLAPPPNGEKARRAIRPGEEETLGWRPAIGLEIPGRAGWNLTALLGKGGFGEVWAGEHAKLRQRRAFKFCFDDERLRALKREVTLVRLLRTALGDRDDIVRFHELKLDEPPFYLESDLAPHGNLLQWAEKQGGLAAIPLTQRIALVAHTATALAAAHSIGVLHKDIKPTNILIFDAPDGTVRPRLVDFGIGTLADPAVLGLHGVTAAGFTRATIEHSTGTPTYSPPEYLAGKPYTVQGDIYGLGVLLYQLLTADSTRPLAPGWERDIPDPLLREDIAACVDGDPARRLPSAADLAERLFHLEQRRAEIAEKERLTREAAARAESEATALANHIRVARLRKLAGAFAVLSLLAIAGGILAWVNQRKANAARSAAEAARTEVVQQKTEVERQKSEVERENAKNRAMLAEAARSDRLVAKDKMKAGRASEAFAYFARSYDYDSRFTFTAERTVAALNSWGSPLPATVLMGHTDKLWSAHFSSDGKRVISASWDRTVRIWDADSGKTIYSFRKSFGEQEAHFSPDGERIVSGAERKGVWVRSSTNGALLVQLIGHESYLSGARFSPDGTRVLTSTDKTARLWDAATGALLATMSGHESSDIKARFSADGQRIVTFSGSGPARVWNSASGELITTLSLPGERFQVSNADFSPDRKRIVISGDNTPRVCDTASGQAVFTLSGHSNVVRDARFSLDGKRIVTASADSTAKTWDAATGKPVMTFTGHGSLVQTAQFNADGNRVLTTSGDFTYSDFTARVWDRRSGRCIATLLGNLVAAEFSPDGSRILAISADHSVRIWNVSDLERNMLAGHKSAVVDVQFSPDGKRIVTASRDKTARIWDATTGTSLAILAGHQEGLSGAQFSPDGTRIVTASWDATARIWDAATGKAVAVSSGHVEALNSVQFSPDGTRIVTASDDKTARVWDSSSGKLLATLSGHEKELITAQFSPDGTRIVTASQEENAARIWDAATGQQIKALSGFENGSEGGKLNAEYSPDGKRILTGSWYKTARVWDAATGQPLLTLSNSFGGNYLVSAHFSSDAARVVTGHDSGDVAISDAFTGKQLATISKQQGLVSAQFNPDATRVITLNRFGTSAGIWDADTGKLVAYLSGHEKGLSTACYSPDGTRIVTGSQDNTARVWDVLPSSAGLPPEWFPDFLRYMAQMRLNTDGELETLKAADWLTLRERLRGVLRANADTPYLRILRKYVRE